MKKRIASLTAVAGLWLSQSALGQETKPIMLPEGVTAAKPAPLAPSDNQKLADTVAATLRQSGIVDGASINIVAVNGVVELSGTVTDLEQHGRILKTVQGVSGIVKIRDGLQVAVMQNETLPVVPREAPPAVNMPVPGRVINGPAVMDPIPLQGGFGGPMLGGPHLPAYAWPTYAPYNNVSRVAYPTHYPYNAWPFIGPFYPFPKVPLGWRSVELKWEDGHWFYGRRAGGHDHWRVRFW